MKLKIPVKTLKNGFSMPVLGIGTWHMGGQTLKDASNDKQELESIKTALELGATSIDTAELYGAGHAEELIAQAVDSAGVDRKKLFITSKVMPIHAGYKDVIKSCENSLKRLNMDYLDLYLIHWHLPLMPLQETMKAFNFLQKEGKIKNFGVSNFSVEQLQTAQSYSEEKIVNNQVEYNLLQQKGLWAPHVDVKNVELPYCQKNDILLTAYTPLAKGRLASPAIPLLDEIAEKYGKTQSQVSLNWLISQKNVVTIPKATHIEHLKDNLGCIGWKLSPADMKKLDNLNVN